MLALPILGLLVESSRQRIGNPRRSLPYHFLHIASNFYVDRSYPSELSHSTFYTFNLLYIRPSIHSTFYTFNLLYTRPSIHSIFYTNRGYRLIRNGVSRSGIVQTKPVFVTYRPPSNIAGELPPDPPPSAQPKPPTPTPKAASLTSHPPKSSRSLQKHASNVSNAPSTQSATFPLPSSSNRLHPSDQTAFLSSSRFFRGD